MKHIILKIEPPSDKELQRIFIKVLKKLARKLHRKKLLKI